MMSQKTLGAFQHFEYHVLVEHDENIHSHNNFQEYVETGKEHMLLKLLYSRVLDYELHHLCEIVKKLKPLC